MSFVVFVVYSSSDEKLNNLARRCAMIHVMLQIVIADWAFLCHRGYRNEWLDPRIGFLTKFYKVNETENVDPCNFQANIYSI